MNPMQALTQRERVIKRRIVEARAAGVWGEPLAALKQQLASIYLEKRNTLESITGMKLPLFQRPDSKGAHGKIMGIPDFLFKH